VGMDGEGGKGKIMGKDVAKGGGLAGCGTECLNGNVFSSNVTCRET
jgi:hypothetical protein